MPKIGLFAIFAVLTVVYNNCEVINPKHDSTQTSSKANEIPVRQLDALSMVDRNSPDLYFGDGKVVTMSWDIGSLDVSPAALRVPGFFYLDVRVDYEVVNGENIAKGYTFSNPRIRLMTGEIEIEMEAVIVYINGEKATNIEPFLSARKIARGYDATVIYSGSVNAPSSGVSNVDKIGIGLGYVVSRARTDNPPIPPAPTLTVPNSFARTTTVPITIGGDSTARMWCVTVSAVQPASTAANCPGYESATSNGWQVTRPANFDLTKIGRAIQQGETINIYLWVANSDLKINTTAPTAQITFDATAPAAPTFASVNIVDTQIADLVGLNDYAEPVTWCVKESAVQTDLANSNGCTFSATKPAWVGLKGGGVRYVAVFARDRAGNTSNPSTVRSVNNTFGRITHAMLIDPAQAARAVFYNRCYSCHNTGMAQAAIWNASDYANTVTNKTKIINRLNNLTGKPEAGLDPKENALIQLWLTQTTTPVQQ